MGESLESVLQIEVSRNGGLERPEFVQLSKHELALFRKRDREAHERAHRCLILESSALSNAPPASCQALITRGASRAGLYTSSSEAHFMFPP